jgi:hypothetical protein
MFKESEVGIQARNSQNFQKRADELYFNHSDMGFWCVSYKS